MELKTDNNLTKSNNNDDWAKHYDYYEVEFRDNYKKAALYQNESHFELLKKNIKEPENKIFAEIGFGAGLTLRYSSRIFKNVYGLDISPKNVELTQKEVTSEGFENIQCFVTNIMQKNEQFKEKFDVISFIHGIEHFSESDYPIIFENIKYYLKPGGVFTGALPNNLPFNFRMCPKCGEIFELDGHLSRHTIDSLISLFNVQNFKIIHISDMNWKWYFRTNGIIKTIYQFIKQKLFHVASKFQLEFIVASK